MRRSILQAVQPRPWRALSTQTSLEVDTDVVVIGAGVVGLAAGRALANSGREVLVLDAGPTVGTETSSRNSEVIHAGNLNLDRLGMVCLALEGVGSGLVRGCRVIA